MHLNLIDDAKLAAQYEHDIAKDVPVIKDILWGEEQWNQVLEYGGNIAIASLEKDSEPIGLMSWYAPVIGWDEYRPENKCVYLLRFGILPDHRRKGYGRQLWQTLCDGVISEEGEYIFFHCHTDHKMGYDFWTAVGCNVHAENIEFDGYPDETYYRFEKALKVTE